MMRHDMHQWGKNDDIGPLIGRLPYRQPDPGLADRIMAALKPRKKALLKRIYHRCLTPMTFSVSPALGVLALLLFTVPAGLGLFRYFHARPAAFSNPQEVGQTQVVFHFKDAAAQSVSVIGTFNNWDPKGYEMRRNPKTGDWVFKTRLAPGKHEYVFLVNGEKVYADPKADLRQKDEYGSSNSVLFIKGRNGQKI